MVKSMKILKFVSLFVLLNVIYGIFFIWMYHEQRIRMHKNLLVRLERSLSSSEQAEFLFGEPYFEGEYEEAFEKYLSGIEQIKMSPFEAKKKVYLYSFDDFDYCLGFDGENAMLSLYKN